MIFNMLEYYEMLQKMHINIIYSGPIISDGIEGIALTLKKRLEFDEMPLSASQSVFSVFVEQMTNMLMYSADEENIISSELKNSELPKGVFILGQQEKNYFVQSGNLIKKESANLLKDKIDYLNTLDKAGLRKYYKEQIKSENSNPESKGAGLGLIEIARRASSKIEYDFTPLEDGLMFYTMYVSIEGGSNGVSA